MIHVGSGQPGAPLATHLARRGARTEPRIRDAVAPLLPRALWALLLLLGLGGRARLHPAAAASTRVETVGCVESTAPRPLAAAAPATAALR